MGKCIRKIDKLHLLAGLYDYIMNIITREWYNPVTNVHMMHGVGCIYYIWHPEFHCNCVLCTGKSQIFPNYRLIWFRKINASRYSNQISENDWIWVVSLCNYNRFSLHCLHGIDSDCWLHSLTKTTFWFRAAAAQSLSRQQLLPIAIKWDAGGTHAAHNTVQRELRKLLHNQRWTFINQLIDFSFFWGKTMNFRIYK